MIVPLRLSRAQFALAAAYAAAFIALFWPTFLWMSERFNAYDSFYSHGWLIPAASAWLLWKRRDRLDPAIIKPDYRGLLLLIPSVVLHLTATWLSVGFVSGFAMLMTLWGLVITLYGPRVFWALRFPLLFLLFMVPLPGILLIAASFKMKMMAATMAVNLLDFMGITAQQMGSTIYLRGVTVIVDDTCSGLRSLITLIALSVLWISLLPKEAKPWQKLTMVAASVPIALVANMARIMVLVLTAAIYGHEAAEGFIHYGSGIVVFGVAVAALAWLGNRIAPQRGEG